MSLRPALRRTAAVLGRLARDARGVSAVEFALILPVMLVIYAGCVELSTALAIDRMVNRTASTIGDLFSQYSTMTSGDVTNVLDASSAIITPYPSATIKLLVYTVNVSTTGQKTIGCVSTRHSPANVPTKGSSTIPHTIPAGIAENGSQVIIAVATYHYDSPFSSITAAFTGGDGYDLNHVYMIRPRLGTPVTWC